MAAVPFGRRLGGRDDAALAGDAAVELGPAVAVEVEQRAACSCRTSRGRSAATITSSPSVSAWATISPDGAMIMALGQRVDALLDAALGDADDPRAVLVGAGLHHQVRCGSPARRSWLGIGRVVDRRVVAAQDQLDALQPHHPVRLGPAPVVADHHARRCRRTPATRRSRRGRARSSSARGAGTAARLVLLVAGEVHLAVAWRRPRRRARRGSACCSGGAAVGVGGQLGVAEAEPDAEARRLVEQRLACRRRGISRLEEGVELVWSVEEPAGEERRERELGEHDELAPAVGGLAQQREQPLDHLARACRSRCDRPHLRGARRVSGRGVTPSLRSPRRRGCEHAPASSTLAPASRSAASVCSAGLWLMPPTLGTKTIAGRADPGQHLRVVTGARRHAPHRVAERARRVASTRSTIVGVEVDRLEAGQRARRRSSTPSRRRSSSQNAASRALGLLRARRRRCCAGRR